MYASPFNQLSSLKNIDVSRFDNAKVVSIESMFSTLKDLSIENLNKVNTYAENLLFNQQMEEELLPNAAHESKKPYTAEERQADEDMLD